MSVNLFTSVVQFSCVLAPVISNNSIVNLLQQSVSISSKIYSVLLLYILYCLGIYVWNYKTDDNEKMADIINSEGSSLINPPDSGYRVYRRRWFMLAIFVIFSMSNSYAWVQYASISDTVADNYNVSISTVDMLCTVYFVVYLVAILPVMWLIENSNLKVTIVLGAFAQFVGSWIRYAGTLKHSISLHFVGQMLCGVGLPCTFGMSSQMAGTWFGIEEVSLASALGFIGVEVGIGIAFVVPSLVVQNGPDVDQQMSSLFLYTAIAMSCIFILTFAFQTKPPLPPSRPRMNVVKAGKMETYFQSLQVILRNRNFILLLVAFAFSIGFLSTLSVVLKQFLDTAYLEQSSAIIRQVGIAKIVAGIIGPLAAGLWLDRSKAFRSTSRILTILIAIAVCGFSVSLNYSNAPLTIASICLYWFCVATFFIVGSEHAVELTYPESEIMSSGLLNAMGLVVAIILVQTIEYTLSKSSLFVKTSFCFIVQLVPVISTMFIGESNRRQDADQDNYQNVNENTEESMETNLD